MLREFKNYQIVLGSGLLAVAMAACTPNKVERPPALGLDVPDAFARSTSQAGGQSGSAAQNWLTDLATPELQSVIDLAMTANPNLLATAARLRQSEAQLTISGAARLPTLGASFDFNRLQNRFTGPTGETASVRQSNYQLSGQLRWELDVWGRLAAQDAAALSDAYASQADLDAGRLSLAGQVAQAWFNLTSARLQYDLAQTRVESFERSNAIVRSRYKRGITNALDVYLSESNLASAKSLQAQRSNELEQSRRVIEVLIGKYPSAELQGDLSLPPLDKDIPTGLPSELLARRPDVQAAQARLIAADYRYSAAKRALLPQFSLTVTGGQRTETLDQFLNFSDLVYNLATNITQPIFQGGRLVATVRLEDARRDERLANYAGSLLTAFQEVENALAADEFLGEQVKHLSDAAREAQAAEKLAEQQYSRGITPLLNLLDAQRRYLDAQSQYLEVARARINNRVQLHLALGGAFEAEETPLKLTGLDQ